MFACHSSTNLSSSSLSSENGQQQEGGGVVATTSGIAVAAGECNITSFNRKRCPACRFAKCLKAGMRVDAIREDRHRGGRSSYEGSRFQLPRGTLFKRKYIENIYGGVELVYAFQVPAEPVVPKLIAEIVKINDVILMLKLSKNSESFWTII